MRITERGRQMYEDCKFLESRGWREECPLPNGWRFSHPDHGIKRFEHALAIEKGHVLPTQTYLPANFHAEAERIKRDCKPRYNYLKERWEYRDVHGNVFDLDFNRGSVTIN